MGKNVGWGPHRGHLVVCALSVLLMAAGPSSAIAQITRVDVPAVSALYHCSTFLNGPADTPITGPTATANTPNETGSDTSSMTTGPLQPVQCGTQATGIEIYKVQNATLKARINQDEVNQEDPLVSATSELNNVSFLGNIVKYTKKKVETTCSDITGGSLCKTSAVYTGLNFAGVDRVVPTTTSKVTFPVDNYELSVLNGGPCRPVGPVASLVRFTGTLTLNDVTIDDPERKILIARPVRLTGELRCVLSGKVVNVDMGDTVQIFTSEELATVDPRYFMSMTFKAD